jgi:hypothetical protein
MQLQPRVHTADVNVPRDCLKGGLFEHYGGGFLSVDGKGLGCSLSAYAL